MRNVTECSLIFPLSWFPVGLFVVVFVPLAVYMMWDSAESFAENLIGYGLFDYLTGLAGLMGALVSGMAINTLRKRGFKMF